MHCGSAPGVVDDQHFAREVEPEVTLARFVGMLADQQVAAQAGSEAPRRSLRGARAAWDRVPT
jgi:hypothetical protein